jgi:inorganic pyrophosphatase
VSGIRWYQIPAETGVSWWHQVELHVKDWLDEDTGLFRYVNEIPRGALQKFEVQTGLRHNAIMEDAKGTRRLQEFGQAVPFNYGCFPQTFRDPEELDDIHGAPGDNDPLDVLDLTQEAVDPGAVVSCRVLGAVCLIDEGRADWKVIVVNVEAKDPLASAESIEDVERLAPGRVHEALRWMDDFKQHSSKSGTVLHFDIQDRKHAVKLIEKDHEAWSRLVAEAGSDGKARGQHWIREPQESQLGSAQVLQRQWAPRRSPRTSSEGAFVGALPSHAPRAGELTFRRQCSWVSSASASSSDSRSSDADISA